MDCIAYGVTKSWTRLSDFHVHYLLKRYVRVCVCALQRSSGKEARKASKTGILRERLDKILKKLCSEKTLGGSGPSEVWSLRQDSFAADPLSPGGLWHQVWEAGFEEPGQTYS